jgi:uncharacterized membrane protein
MTYRLTNVNTQTFLHILLVLLGILSFAIPGLPPSAFWRVKMSRSDIQTTLYNVLLVLAGLASILFSPYRQNDDKVMTPPGFSQD